MQAFQTSDIGNIDSTFSYTKNIEDVGHTGTYINRKSIENIVCPNDLVWNYFPKAGYKFMNISIRWRRNSLILTIHMIINNVFMFLVVVIIAGL